MEKLAVLQIHAYMPVLYAGLEKKQITCPQLIFVYTLAQLCLKLCRSRQHDAKFRFECHVNETGAINTASAQATHLIPGIFPLIVLGIQSFFYHWRIAEVYLSPWHMHYLSATSFGYATASCEHCNHNDARNQAILHERLPWNKLLS